MVFHRVAQVSDYGDKAMVALMWQIKRGKHSRAAQTGARLDAFHIQPVVDSNYLFRAHALFDQLPANRFGIGNDGMRHAIAQTFYELLRVRAPARSLAARCDANRHARHSRGCHPEYVCVKVMRMHDADLALPQESSKPAKLRNHIAVIEAGQSVFRNLTKSQLALPRRAARHCCPDKQGSHHNGHSL